MFHRTVVRATSAGVLTVATLVSGCRDNPLAVENKNDPNVSNAFSTPGNVETVGSKLFQQMYNGQYGSSDDLWTQTITMSFESSSQLGNFGMGTRGAIPRSPIDNSIGNTVAGGNFRDFDFLSRNARSAANTIAAIDRFSAQGSPVGGSAALSARDKSFAYFTLGFATGNLALFYDSAAVVSPTDSGTTLPPLSGSAVMIAAAMADLDSALALSSNSAVASGWPIPAGWMAASSDITLSRWQQIIRSYRARFRAGYPRTPVARAAVDWTAVIADATNGITSDIVVNTDATTSGWDASPQTQLAVSSGWSQMTPFVLGMADSSRAYDAWLGTPVLSRTPFLLVTADKRFPSGNTRAAQIANTGSGRAGTPAGTFLYFRAHPTGEDTPADPWGTWWYDNWRFWSIRAAGTKGPFVIFAVAENDMLAAEGYIRTGNVAAAAKLIDKTRVSHGSLPALTGVVTSAMQAVPGGNSCVPRVPQPPSYTATACGNIFEAMKWEKRVETSLTGYGQWFIDSRGWGDLVQGTPLEWPVPYQELYARYGSGRAPYTTTAVATKGTYGF